MTLLFCVQVWCADQWMTLDHAQALERHAANAVYHQEVLIVSHERVRMVPLRKEKAR